MRRFLTARPLTEQVTSAVGAVLTAPRRRVGDAADAGGTERPPSSRFTNRRRTAKRAVLRDDEEGACRETHNQKNEEVPSLAAAPDAPSGLPPLLHNPYHERAPSAGPPAATGATDASAKGTARRPATSRGPTPSAAGEAPSPPQTITVSIPDPPNVRTCSPAAAASYLLTLRRTLGSSTAKLSHEGGVLHFRARRFLRDLTEQIGAVPGTAAPSPSMNDPIATIQHPGPTRRGADERPLHWTDGLAEEVIQLYAAFGLRVAAGALVERAAHFLHGSGRGGETAGEAVATAKRAIAVHRVLTSSAAEMRFAVQQILPAALAAEAAATTEAREGEGNADAAGALEGATAAANPCGSSPAQYVTFLESLHRDSYWLESLLSQHLLPQLVEELRQLCEHEGDAAGSPTPFTAHEREAFSTILSVLGKCLGSKLVRTSVTADGQKQVGFHGLLSHTIEELVTSAAPSSNTEVNSANQGPTRRVAAIPARALARGLARFARGLEVDGRGSISAAKQLKDAGTSPEGRFGAHGHTNSKGAGLGGHRGMAPCTRTDAQAMANPAAGEALHRAAYARTERAMNFNVDVIFPVVQFYSHSAAFALFAQDEPLVESNPHAAAPGAQPSLCADVAGVSEAATVLTHLLLHVIHWAHVSRSYQIAFAASLYARALDWHPPHGGSVAGFHMAMLAQVRDRLLDEADSQRRRGVTGGAAGRGAEEGEAVAASLSKAAAGSRFSRKRSAALGMSGKALAQPEQRGAQLEREDTCFYQPLSVAEAFTELAEASLKYATMFSFSDLSSLLPALATVSDAVESARGSVPSTTGNDKEPRSVDLIREWVAGTFSARASRLMSPNTKRSVRFRVNVSATGHASGDDAAVGRNDSDPEQLVSFEEVDGGKGEMENTGTRKGDVLSDAATAQHRHESARGRSGGAASVVGPSFLLKSLKRGYHPREVTPAELSAILTALERLSVVRAPPRQAFHLAGTFLSLRHVTKFISPKEFTELSTFALRAWPLANHSPWQPWDVIDTNARSVDDRTKIEERAHTVRLVMQSFFQGVTSNAGTRELTVTWTELRRRMDLLSPASNAGASQAEREGAATCYHDSDVLLRIHAPHSSGCLLSVEEMLPLLLELMLHASPLDFSAARSIREAAFNRFRVLLSATWRFLEAPDVATHLTKPQDALPSAEVRRLLDLLVPLQLTARLLLCNDAPDPEGGVRHAALALMDEALSTRVGSLLQQAERAEVCLGASGAFSTGRHQLNLAALLRDCSSTLSVPDELPTRAARREKDDKRMEVSVVESGRQSLSALWGTSMAVAAQVVSEYLDAAYWKREGCARLPSNPLTSVLHGVLSQAQCLHRSSEPVSLAMWNLVPLVAHVETQNVGSPAFTADPSPSVALDSLEDALTAASFTQTTHTPLSELLSLLVRETNDAVKSCRDGVAPRFALVVSLASLLERTDPRFLSSRLLTASAEDAALSPALQRALLQCQELIVETASDALTMDKAPASRLESATIPTTQDVMTLLTTLLRCHRTQLSHPEGRLITAGERPGTQTVLAWLLEKIQMKNAKKRDAAADREENLTRSRSAATRFRYDEDGDVMFDAPDAGASQADAQRDQQARPVPPHTLVTDELPVDLVVVNAFLRELEKLPAASPIGTNNVQRPLIHMTRDVVLHALEAAGAWRLGVIRTAGTPLATVTAAAVESRAALDGFTDCVRALAELAPELVLPAIDAFYSARPLPLASAGADASHSRKALAPRRQRGLRGPAGSGSARITGSTVDGLLHAVLLLAKLKDNPNSGVASHRSASSPTALPPRAEGDGTGGADDATTPDDSNRDRNGVRRVLHMVTNYLTHELSAAPSSALGDVDMALLSQVLDLPDVQRNRRLCNYLVRQVRHIWKQQLFPNGHVFTASASEVWLREMRQHHVDGMMEPSSPFFSDEASRNVQDALAMEHDPLWRSRVLFPVPPPYVVLCPGTARAQRGTSASHGTRPACYGGRQGTGAGYAALALVPERLPDALKRVSLGTWLLLLHNGCHIQGHMNYPKLASVLQRKQARADRRQAIPSRRRTTACADASKHANALIVNNQEKGNATTGPAPLLDRLHRVFSSMEFAFCGLSMLVPLPPHLVSELRRSLGGLGFVSLACEVLRVYSAGTLASDRAWLSTLAAATARGAEVPAASAESVSEERQSPSQRTYLLGTPPRHLTMQQQQQQRRHSSLSESSLAALAASDELADDGRGALVLPTPWLQPWLQEGWSVLQEMATADEDGFMQYVKLSSSRAADAASATNAGHEMVLDWAPIVDWCLFLEEQQPHLEEQRAARVLTIHSDEERRRINEEEPLSYVPTLIQILGQLEANWRSVAAGEEATAVQVRNLGALLRYCCVSQDESPLAFAPAGGREPQCQAVDSTMTASKSLFAFHEASWGCRRAGNYFCAQEHVELLEAVRKALFSASLTAVHGGALGSGAVAYRSEVRRRLNGLSPRDLAQLLQAVLISHNEEGTSADATAAQRDEISLLLETVQEVLEIAQGTDVLAVARALAPLLHTMEAQRYARAASAETNGEGQQHERQQQRQFARELRRTLAGIPPLAAHDPERFATHDACELFVLLHDASLVSKAAAKAVRLAITPESRLEEQAEFHNSVRRHAQDGEAALRALWAELSAPLPRAAPDGQHWRRLIHIATFLEEAGL